MMKKMLRGMILLLCASMALAEAPVTVVTSFSILGDLTRNIGKGRVKVLDIVGPEKDTHTFLPSPRDVKKLKGARLVLINGLGLEGWIPRMVSASGYKNKIVEVGEDLPSLLKEKEPHGHCHGHGHGHSHDHDHYDPHVWQDPVLTKAYVQNIAVALTLVDPAGKAVYEANKKAYHAKLDALHAWVEETLSSIPVAKRRAITSHDAFSYLGHRYQITFLSPQGTNTESEASAKDVASLVQQIRKTGVRALFVENISSPQIMETLSAETKVRLGGRLYSDALAKDAPADTYIGMYRYNIETLLSGLKQN